MATWVWAPTDGRNAHFYQASRPWEEQFRGRRGCQLPAPFAGAPIPSWDTEEQEFATPTKKDERPRAQVEAGTSAPRHASPSDELRQLMERQFAIFGLQLAELQATVAALPRSRPQSTMEDLLAPPPQGSPLAEAEARGIEDLLMDLGQDDEPRVSGTLEMGEL